MFTCTILVSVKLETEMSGSLENKKCNGNRSNMCLCNFSELSQLLNLIETQWKCYQFTLRNTAGKRKEKQFFVYFNYQNLNFHCLCYDHTAHQRYDCANSVFLWSYKVWFLAHAFLEGDSYVYSNLLIYSKGFNFKQNSYFWQEDKIIVVHWIQQSASRVM